MHKQISGLAAAAIAGALMVAVPAPASAQGFGFSFGIGDADRRIGDYCDHRPRSRDCREWRREHRDWDRDDYVRFFTRNDGFSFGFRIGTDDDDRRWDRDDDGRWRDRDDDFDHPRRYRLSEDHIDRCEDEYRSYDVRTDTYLGYDGKRHYCNL